MNTLAELKGSIVALVTPFNTDGSVDFTSLERLIEFHIISQTDGIVVCGTTGEASTLTDQEYKEVVSYVVDQVDNRIPVIAGSGSNSTTKALHLSQIAVECGVDGLLVVTPYYNKPNARGIYAHFQYIAENVNIPIVLYNVPSRTGTNLNPEQVLRLANDFENIVAVKEASGDLNQVMEIIQNRPQGFNVYSGDDTLALSMIALGAEGCISVAANTIPLAFHELMHAGLNNDMHTARDIQYRYLDIMNLNFIESNPIPIKESLHFMGMIKNEFRLPLSPMHSEVNRVKLQAELSSLGLINRYSEVLN